MTRPTQQPSSPSPNNLDRQEKIMAFFFVTAILLMLAAKFLFGF